LSNQFKPGIETLALHAGQRPDQTTGSRATPIYQSTSFVFNDSDKASSLFDVARAGHVYSRISNPTVAVLEERVAALEGLYGGTHNLMSYTLKRFGIETTFVDPRDPAAFAAAIKPNTRLLFSEGIANPRCEVLDIPAVSAIAHEAGLPLMIDATLTSPVLQKPIDLGADIVMHSLTKFMGGHGVAIGGVLVDSGRGPYAYIMRARKEGLRDFGAGLSPGNAFHLLQGLETLPMRMQRHVENTNQLVEVLDEHEAVSVVHHPHLASHPDHELAKTMLPDGCGAVFSFELAGGRPAGSRFIESLNLFSHLANVGDAKSLVIHPASTTHSRMDDQALLEAGIAPGLVRLSVGLEDIKDLKNDLKNALRQAQKVSA